MQCPQCAPLEAAERACREPPGPQDLGQDLRAILRAWTQRMEQYAAIRIDPAYSPGTFQATRSARRETTAGRTRPCRELLARRPQIQGRFT